MPQSNVLFAFLFVGFAVWITVRGELATYIGFLIKPRITGTNTAANAGNAGSGTSTAGGPNTAQVAQAALTAAQAVAVA